MSASSGGGSSGSSGCIQLRRGGEAVPPAHCMVHLPPQNSSGAQALGGQVWWYDGAEHPGRLVMKDLGVHATSTQRPVTSPVLCMEVCAKMHIWLGHKAGRVSVWSESQRSMLCPECQVFPGAVTALSVDPYGVAWVGSDAGQVKVLQLSTLRVQAGSAQLKLAVRASLQRPEMKFGERAGSLRTTVHSGPITVIEAYNDRVWTSGGTVRSCNVLEWNMDRQPRAESDVTLAGLMNVLTILPIGLRRWSVTDNLPRSLVQQQTPSPDEGGAENLEDWAVASGHETGAILIWDPHLDSGNGIVPVLRLHPGTGPCRSIMFMAPLHLWCIAYAEGELLLQPVTFLRLEHTTNTDTSGANFIRIKAHDGGLAAATGSDNILITAGVDGAITAWSESELFTSSNIAPVLTDMTDELTENSQEHLMSLYLTSANGATALQAIQKALKSEKSGSDTDPAPSDPGMDSGKARELLAEVVRLMRPAPSLASGPGVSGTELSGSGESIPTPSAFAAQRPTFGSADEDGSKKSLSGGELQLVGSAPLSGTEAVGSTSEAARSAAVSAAVSLTQQRVSRSISGEHSSRGWGSNTFADQATLNWVIAFEDLALIRKVAEGSIGQVYLGRYQETDVAIKALSGLEELRTALSLIPSGVKSNPVALCSWLASAADKDVSAARLLQTLEREVGIMASIRHPNVVLFMGMCIDPPCLVSEWCSRGSVFNILQAAKKTPALAFQLPWHRRLHMALDAAKGVYQLHQHQPPILHCDLKSPNLVCDAHWRVKVTDFNLSRVMDTQSLSSSMVANNPRWQAPEVISRSEFSKSSDVFSMGVVLWELITWELPWHTVLSPYQIMTAVSDKDQRLEFPPLPADEEEAAVVTGLTELIQSCWVRDPEARPAFPSVIASLRSLLELCRTSGLSSTRARRSSGYSKPPISADAALGDTAEAAAAAQQQLTKHLFPVAEAESPRPAKPITAAPPFPRGNTRAEDESQPPMAQGGSPFHTVSNATALSSCDRTQNSREGSGNSPFGDMAALPSFDVASGANSLQPSSSSSPRPTTTPPPPHPSKLSQGLGWGPAAPHADSAGGR